MKQNDVSENLGEKPRGITGICSANLLNKGALTAWNYRRSNQALRWGGPQELKRPRVSLFSLGFTKTCLWVSQVRWSQGFTDGLCVALNHQWTGPHAPNTRSNSPAWCRWTWPWLGGAHIFFAEAYHIAKLEKPDKIWPKGSTLHWISPSASAGC